MKRKGPRARQNIQLTCKFYNNHFNKWNEKDKRKEKKLSLKMHYSGKSVRLSLTMRIF